jgi:hypothetical protein
MNFKTTLVLLVALILVGAVVLFRGRPDDAPASTAPRTLLAVQPQDVTAVTVTPASGQAMSLAKSTDGEWWLTQPVAAAADKFAADDLVRAVTSLESTGQVDASPVTGLDQPRYTIKLETAGKSPEVKVGQRSSVGDNLYVRLDDGGKADLVAAALLDRLKKPANDYRQSRLAPVAMDAVQQVSVTRDGQTVSLAKVNGQWSVVAPAAMPADQPAVSSLLSSLTGLRAEEFVQEGADRAMLGQPRLTIAYSTASPTTQPAATQPLQTITVGRFSDIGRQGVLAIASGTDAVVRLPAASLAAFEKKPLDFRDKQVLSLDVSKVGAIDLSTVAIATTQPTTRPAVNRTVALTRRPVEAVAPAGPALPTTGPANEPAATQPMSKWLAAGDRPANDAAVDALLAAFSPLRAEKFIDTPPPPVAPPLATYVLTLTVPAAGESPGERHELRIVDLGNDAALIGSYNGLTFEFDRALLEVLSAELVPGQ